MFLLAIMSLVTRLLESKKEKSHVCLIEGTRESFSRPGLCGRKVQVNGVAVSVFIAKRAIRGVATKRFSGYLLWISLRSATGFCTFLKRENASRPCFLFSKIARDRYSLRYASVYTCMNFCNLIKSGTQEKLSSESANRCRTPQEAATSNIKIREAPLLQYREKISSSRQASLFAAKRSVRSFKEIK